MWLLHGVRKDKGLQLNDMQNGRRTRKKWLKAVKSGSDLLQNSPICDFNNRKAVKTRTQSLRSSVRRQKLNIFDFDVRHDSSRLPRRETKGDARLL